MSTPRILIIEDDPDGCRSLTEAIQDMGFEALMAANGEDGVRRFREDGCDTVLSDLRLPDIDGLEVMARIQRADRSVPVIIMTAYGTVSSAVDALRAGAYDYLVKPLDLEDIQAKVRRAVETRRLRREVNELQRSMRERYGLGSLVAESPSMRDLVRQIEAVADTNATVLLQGESGTGKELVARALHVESQRRAGPFVAVNCGALAENLLESELFGHEKGAFTGAVARRAGAFERAQGGVLFLDEIGDAPQSVQVKLLRVLEERELVRVGGQASVPVDVRLVTASNRQLDEMVADGQFREDLYYRIKVVLLQIAPLRARREDIRPLADRFIANACKDHGRLITSVEPAFYERLEAHDWPGNVRELRNAIEATVVMARGPVLHAADLRLDALRRADEGNLVLPEKMTLAELEKEALAQALLRDKGNRSLSAEKLGISRRTIQRKIKEYGLPY